MPTFKMTLALDSFRGGWSESFFYEANSPQAAYNNTQGLISARMACSPETVVCIAVRAAQYPDNGPPAATPRVTYTVPIEIVGTMPLSNEGPDLLQNKMALKCFSTGGASRIFWVGGMADFETKFTTDTGKSVPGPLLDAAQSNLRVALSNASIKIRSISPPVGANAWHQVFAVVGQGVAGLSISMQTADPHGLVVNDYVTFGRVNKKLFPGLTGIWQVTTVQSATAFVIGYFNNYPNVATLTPSVMRVRKVSLTYSGLNGALFAGFRAHKVGKSLGESRGRSRAVSFRR